MPQFFLLLSEVWTMTDPRDLRRLVGYAVAAEQAGFDGVMMGEHLVMGPNAARDGKPKNPREWIKSWNQDPTYSHPSSLLVLSAMAAATTRLRLLAAAVLAPLRHPLLLAKELATLDLLAEGRLTVLPAVSWQEEEYRALNANFPKRGEVLDETLDIWRKLWTHGSPVTHHGRHYQFGPSYVEPQPYRKGGPALWFGGRAFAPWAVRRAAKYGSGFFSIVPPTQADLERLQAAMKEAGRDPAELEMAAFIFGAGFKGSDDLLDLDAALAVVPGLMQRGFSTFVIKPSQYINDGAQVGDFCAEVVRKVRVLAGG